MIVIGLDLGSKTLGVAKSDLLGMFAHPYETFRFDNEDYNLAVNYVLKLIKDLKVEKIVLGLPKLMDGSIGTQAQKSLDFKAMLEAKTNIEVIMFDERLSSKSAHKDMLSFDVSRKKRKTKVDQLAAVKFLQAYLDNQKN